MTRLERQLEEKIVAEQRKALDKFKLTFERTEAEERLDKQVKEKK